MPNKKGIQPPELLPEEYRVWHPPPAWGIPSFKACPWQTSWSIYLWKSPWFSPRDPQGLDHFNQSKGLQLSDSAAAGLNSKAVDEVPNFCEWNSFAYLEAVGRRGRCLIQLVSGTWWLVAPSPEPVLAPDIIFKRKKIILFFFLLSPPSHPFPCTCHLYTLPVHSSCWQAASCWVFLGHHCFLSPSWQLRSVASVWPQPGWCVPSSYSPSVCSWSPVSPRGEVLSISSALVFAADTQKTPLDLTLVACGA